MTSSFWGLERFYDLDLDKVFFKNISKHFFSPNSGKESLLLVWVHRVLSHPVKMIKGRFRLWMNIMHSYYFWESMSVCSCPGVRYLFPLCFAQKKRKEEAFFTAVDVWWPKLLRQFVSHAIRAAEHVCISFFFLFIFFSPDDREHTGFLPRGPEDIRSDADQRRSRPFVLWRLGYCRRRRYAWSGRAHCRFSRHRRREVEEGKRLSIFTPPHVPWTYINFNLFFFLIFNLFFISTIAFRFKQPSKHKSMFEVLYTDTGNGRFIHFFCSFKLSVGGLSDNLELKPSSSSFVLF